MYGADIARIGRRNAQGRTRNITQDCKSNSAEDDFKRHQAQKESLMPSSIDWEVWINWTILPDPSYHALGDLSIGKSGIANGSDLLIHCRGSMGGAGFFHLYDDQGYGQVKMFMKFWRSPGSKAGTLLLPTSEAYPYELSRLSYSPIALQPIVYVWCERFPQV
jgi:hypothetical protein